MPHTDEALSLQIIHARRTDNPHVTTGAQLGLGVMQSSNGTVVAPASGSANTVFTAPGGIAALYMVHGAVASGDPTNYSCAALVAVNFGTLRQSNLFTGGLISIGLSGSNIQITQNSGAANNILWTVTRLA